MKKRTRRYVLYFVVFVMCGILYGFFYSFDGRVRGLIEHIDIITWLVIYIVWRSIEFFFAGILVGFLGIPIMFLFHRYLLLAELWFESKVFRSQIVVLDKTPKLSVIFQFKSAYILFGPIVILTKILLTITNISGLNAVLYYYLIGELITQYFWHIILIVVPFYIIIEVSRIRELDSRKLILRYPSRILNWILVFVIGAGSIASLVPMYYDLLGILGDPQIVMYLFFLLILYFYLPALGGILGFLLVVLGLMGGETRRILLSLENSLIRYDIAKQSKIEVI